MKTKLTEFLRQQFNDLPSCTYNLFIPQSYSVYFFTNFSPVCNNQSLDKFVCYSSTKGRVHKCDLAGHFVYYLILHIYIKIQYMRCITSQLLIVYTHFHLFVNVRFIHLCVFPHMFAYICSPLTCLLLSICNLSPDCYYPPTHNKV